MQDNVELHSLEAQPKLLELPPVGDGKTRLGSTASSSSAGGDTIQLEKDEASMSPTKTQDTNERHDSNDDDDDHEDEDDFDYLQPVSRTRAIALVATLTGASFLNVCCQMALIYRLY